MMMSRRGGGVIESRRPSFALSGRGWVALAYWLLWGLAVVLYLAWPVTHLNDYHWTNDEGLYMQRAALANAGYPLYAEVYLNKPPLLVWMLQLAFWLAGPTVAVARFTALCLTLVGFVATGIVAGQLWGRWTGLAAAGVLLLLPETPIRARVVMADLPALAFALAAMGGALLFRRSGRRGWMAFSGATFAAALLIHPLLIHTALPLALIFVLPGLGSPAGKSGHRIGWLDVVVFLGTAAALWLLTLALVDRRHFFRWVLEFNYGAGSDLLEPQKNWERFTGYLKDISPLVWLVVLSTVALGIERENRRWLSVAVVWWFATAAILMVSSPLQKQYLLLLVFPLVVISGGGLATAGNWVVKHLKGERPLRNWRAVLALLMLISVVLLMVDRWEATKPYFATASKWSADHQAARAFIESQTGSEEFVATDDPLVAFAAGRLVPPSLTELSTKQIKVGNLTSDDVRGSLLWYGARVVLFSTNRLERLPGLEAWVASVAAERRDFGELRAYRLDLPHSIPLSDPAYLGNGIELRGYTLSTDELQPGDTLTVMLFWQNGEAVLSDYHVFVHLVDEEGQLWGQHDGPPGRGDRPTGRWKAGQQVFDTHAIEVDPLAPPGRYRLVAGMYGWPSLERLPAFLPDGSRWADDQVLLGEVVVSAP